MTSKESFRNCYQWCQSILKHKGSDVQKILIGNKLDLMQLTGDGVQSAEAKAFAAENKMDYFETSALRGDGVDEAINSIITKVYEAKVRPQLEAIAKGAEEEKPDIDLRHTVKDPKTQKGGCCN